MKATLVDAITSLFMIQRWNFLPRVETWVEAENVAYSTHIGFALLCEVIKEPTEFKTLAFDYISHETLKPLTKHFLSDVPYKFKRALNKIIDDRNTIFEEQSKALHDQQKIMDNLKLEPWEKKVQARALKDTLPLFPRMIRPQVEQYLIVSSESDPRIQSLIKYVQRRTALHECETNATVYREYYQGYIDEITESINNFGKDDPWMKKLDDAFNRYDKPGKTGDSEVDKIPGYIKAIRNLKYLRRWNRINRSIETNVLSHTYVVTLLSLMFTWMHGKNNGFGIQALQRALFHDVPEALTGDIITPVKEIIKKEYPTEKDLWAAIENELAKNPIKKLIGIHSNLSKYIDENHLLEDVSDNEKDSVSSLVKDCDRMALAIECIQEDLVAKIPLEMSTVYPDYLEELQNSEWPYIREFAAKLATRYNLATH